MLPACAEALAPRTYPASQVEVDVYRSLGAKRAEPLPGCSSFFQASLPWVAAALCTVCWLAAAHG